MTLRTDSSSPAPSPQKVTVIGDGGFGTALALVLHRNGHDVTVWGFAADTIDAIKSSGQNKMYLPGIDLPPDIHWTTDREEAVKDAVACVLAIPSKYFSDICASFNGLIPASCQIVSVAKGLREGKRMSVIAGEQLNHPAATVLSGPSHAEEVALGTPTAVVAACHEPERAKIVQSLFNGRGFRVYTSNDPIGVEVGAAMKNVIAIAAGISDGLGYGDNAKASLVTRGLAEMIRLGSTLGGQTSTFSGLSGIGDLMVTCGSHHSRNRGFGERLGKGETKEEIIDSMNQVAEGVWNAATIHEIGVAHKIDLPITDQVFQILYEGKNAAEAVNDLLSREPKPE